MLSEKNDQMYSCILVLYINICSSFPAIILGCWLEWWIFWFVCVSVMYVTSCCNGSPFEDGNVLSK